MLESTPGLMAQIRAKFAHVDHCPFQGDRIFFENAGGALTLNSVVQTTAKFAAIPDNQGRDNPAANALVQIIAQGRADASVFFNAKGGQIIVGESGTELLFRTIRAAILGAEGTVVLGSTLEHPASASARDRWAGIAGKTNISVAHDPETGSVSAESYLSVLTPETAVATILHTSPVTGMGVDVVGIARAIRSVAPECFIVVDGIQHAAHGGIDVTAADVDAYVISPYKVFSRHGYGLAWISDRLSELSHDALLDAPATQWELGTRDTGAYATFSDVVGYFDWLGAQVGTADTTRGRIEDASRAIHAQEKLLTDTMLHGSGNLTGLAQLNGVTIIGGIDNPLREGLVSFTHAECPATEIVARLNDMGIRTHTRKADHYSGNILRPLGLDGCVRVSLCHYNTTEEVRRFLAAMAEILGE